MTYSPRLTRPRARALLVSLAREAVNAEARLPIADTSSDPIRDAWRARRDHPTDATLRQLSGKLWQRTYKYAPRGSHTQRFGPATAAVLPGAQDDKWTWLIAALAAHGITCTRPQRGQIARTWRDFIAATPPAAPDPNAQPGGPGPVAPGDPNSIDVDDVAPIMVPGGGPCSGMVADLKPLPIEDLRPIWRQRAQSLPPRTPFPLAPALARAFTAQTRPRERVSDDGDLLATTAAPVVACGLREPALALHVRAASSRPALQLYLDVSSSMSDSGGGPMYSAAATVHAIAHAARQAGIARQVIAFELKAMLLADWREPLVPSAYSNGGTNLPNALLQALPMLAARPEHRRIALVLIDGDVGRPQEWVRVRALCRARSIELYAIGIGVNPFKPMGDVSDWDACEFHGRVPWDGAFRLDDVADLSHRASQELISVLGKRVGS